MNLFVQRVISHSKIAVDNESCSPQHILSLCNQMAFEPEKIWSGNDLLVWE